MLNSVTHDPFMLPLTALNVKRDSTTFVGEAALGLPSALSSSGRMGHMFSNEELKREAEKDQQKIDEIMSLIASSSRSVPRTEFKKMAKEKKTYMMLLCQPVFFACFLGEVMRLKDEEGISPVFLIIFIAVTVLILLYEFFRNEKLACVSGDTLFIKKNTYPCDQIDYISAYGINYINVYSHRKRILSFGMTASGADEFVKWAKFHEIPVEQTGDGDLTAGKKALITVAGMLVLAAITGGFLWLCLR